MTIDWSKAPEDATHYFHEHRKEWLPYGYNEFGREHIRLAIPRPAALGSPIHPDNMAVFDLANAMRNRLAECRTAGKSGWDDPEQCPPQRLADGLVRAVHKGDLIDVANYAAMLYARRAETRGGGLTEWLRRAVKRDATVHAESAPVEWDGTGLPPVGAVCEYYRDDGRVVWHQGRVVGHDGNGAVVADDTVGRYYAAPHPELRPSLTPEQRAAKERDEAVAAMLTDMALDSEVSMRDADAARALYAAGWRKTEGE